MRAWRHESLARRCGNARVDMGACAIARLAPAPYRGSMSFPGQP